MNVLKDILYKVSLTATYGDMERRVSDVVFDSRKVIENAAFIAVKGTQVDGHDFIPLALEKGATAIICEQLPDSLAEGITYIQVVDSAKALGIMAANFYKQDVPIESSQNQICVIQNSYIPNIWVSIFLPDHRIHGVAGRHCIVQYKGGFVKRLVRVNAH